MFALIRFLISLAMLAVFVWFAVTVPIGKRTLWGHARAIWGTQEAKDLADGTKEEAEKVAERVRQELHSVDMGAAPRRAHAPLDPVDERDRRNLDRLVKQKSR
jgi:hypothetical protein